MHIPSRTEPWIATGLLAFLALQAFALPRGLAAQGNQSGLDAGEGVRLFGSVVDRSTGEPVSGAAIVIAAADGAQGPTWEGQSDSEGRFQTEVLPAGAYELNVRAVPFTRISYLLTLLEEGVVDVRVEMVQVDYEIDPVVAFARRRTKLEREGFYERRDIGRGHFITREEIQERSVMRLADVFRGVPGARVILGRFGRGDVVLLRGGCVPVVVLDGVVMSNPVRIDELFPVSGVEGIEVYHGAAAPMQYVGMTTCGVIMLWSRDPAAGGGRTLTWKRFLTAAGIGLLIAFGAG